jgi:FKBP-type peptidyl-prolyl cis-trans isomerase
MFTYRPEIQHFRFFVLIHYKINSSYRTFLSVVARQPTPSDDKPSGRTHNRHVATGMMPRRIQLVTLAALAAAALPAGVAAYVPHNVRMARGNTLPFHRSAATRLYSSAAAPSAAATTTTTLADGLVKTVTRSGSGPTLRPGDIATLAYCCYYNDVPFSRALLQKVVVGDGTMIPGWDKALKTMRVGERAVVQLLSAEWGYGPNEVPGILPPNAAPIVMELEVLDRQDPTDNIDFDSLAMADATPRTATDIAAAFERKQAQKAKLGPAKEGLEAWIEKAQNFYFFGLFEGETGERPPWFLRPSITFPLAFLVVGAAFYITFAGGAIYERGAQVKDELDEFIVSYNALPASLVVAMSLVATQLNL